MHPQDSICSYYRRQRSYRKISYISVVVRRVYRFHIFPESNSSSGKVRVFRWDPEKRIVDPEAFDGIDYINSSCRSKYR